MRKFLALALCLVLCLSCVAMAEEIPSVTASTKAQIETNVDGLAVIVSDDMEDWQTAIIEKMVNGDPMSVLDAEAVAAAGAEEGWVVKEAYELVVAGYTDDMGDVQVTLKSLTSYDDACGIVLTYADGTAEGFAATANEAGELVVTLPQATMQKLSQGSALLTVIGK